MRNLPAILILFCITMQVLASDFKNLNWGMSPEQVKKNSKATLIKDKTGFQFQQKILRKTASCFLLFHNNKLYKSIYQFNFDTGTPSNEYISFYKKMRNLLIKKYGKPKVLGDDEFFVKEKDDFYNYKRASTAEKRRRKIMGIILGEVSCDTYWNLPRTYIEITLFSIKTGKYSRQAVLQINYRTQNKKLIESVKNQADKNIIDEL